MSKPEIIAGLDIGSGQVVCVIGRRMPDQDQIEVIAAARRDCFRTGATVAQCLEAQKAKGFRGRRKYIRKQVALERIALR